MKKYNIEDLTAEALMEMVQEVNGWDGSLGRFDYWVNDGEFFSTFYDGRPMEAVQAAYYGDYQYHDEYVRMDGVENLVSASEYALEAELLENAEEIFSRYRELVSAGNIDNAAEVVIWSAEEIYEAAMDEYGEDLAHVSSAEVLDYCQYLADYARAGYNLRDMALEVANGLFEGED